MEFLKLFEHWQNVESFSAGDVIFSEEDPADALYIILSGDVELALHGSSLGVESTGSIIGEMAIIPSESRNETATALGGVRLARVEREEFDALIRQDAEFSLHAMAELARRLRAVDRYISNHLSK